jgi:Trk K+ transport system NAD-binding subunit
MYIIIVGGGKVGYYLAKSLLREGHEVAGGEGSLQMCRTQ